MKAFVPVILLGFATVAVILTIFGGESYGRLNESRRALLSQQDSNHQLKTRVDSLKREVRGLQSDNRSLEKTARNELGLARSDEMVFIFEGDSIEPQAVE